MATHSVPHLIDPGTEVHGSPAFSDHPQSIPFKRPQNGAHRRFVSSTYLQDSVSIPVLQRLIPDPDSATPEEYDRGLAELDTLAANPFGRRIRQIAGPGEFAADAIHTEHGGHDDTSGSLRPYLREISRIRLLTPAEEIGLAKRIEVGDQDARNQMVAANLRLVVCVARRYARPDRLPIMDLIGEGNLGLIRAAEKFDWRKGYRFSTYATWWIWQAIFRALAGQERTIRMPMHAVERLDRIRKAAARLAQRLGRDPTDAEIAADAGLAKTSAQLAKQLGREPSDEEIAADLTRAMRVVRDLRAIARDPVSLHAPFPNGDHDEDRVVADTQSDLDAVATDVAAVMNATEGELQRDLEDVLATFLPARERTVLVKQLGLFGSRVHTLEELAVELHMAPPRVRALEARAMKRLRIPSVQARLMIHRST